MSTEAISQRAARHVAAFNDGVRSGNWAAFANRFTPDATMRFIGVPAGPFTGREEIAAGYACQPPSDTLTVTRGISRGDVDELWFAASLPAGGGPQGGVRVAHAVPAARGARPHPLLPSGRHAGNDHFGRGLLRLHISAPTGPGGARLVRIHCRRARCRCGSGDRGHQAGP